MRVKVIAWFAIGYEAGQTLFASGQVLEGMGMDQREPVTPPQTTLGALRAELGYGNEEGGRLAMHNEMGQGLPDDTPAWLYGNDDEETNSFVVVEVTLA